MPSKQSDFLHVLSDSTGVSLSDVGRIVTFLGLPARGRLPAHRESEDTYFGLVDDSINVLEALRCRYRSAIAEGYVPPKFPAHVQIQTIAGCNASCVMCAMSMPKIRQLQRGVMPDDLYHRIVGECSRAAACEELALYLQNEPLLDRDLPRRIRVAKELSRGRLRVRIVTNGNLLTARVIDDLIAGGLDGIAVSLNAHSPRTYQRVMGGLDYELTRNNIELLLEKAPPSLFVSITFIVIAENEREIEDAISYWSERGVYCGAYGVNTLAGTLTEFDAIQPKQAKTRTKECYLPFESIGVLATGEVILCCTDWGRLSLSGNLTTQPLEAIWHSRDVAEFRRQALLGFLNHKMCADCLGQTRVRENLLYQGGPGSNREKGHTN